MNENDKKGMAETKSGVSAKLPSEGSRIKKAISPMTGSELLDYALYKVIIPYGKKAIMDILDRFFNTSPSSSSSPAATVDRTSYSSVFAAKSVQTTALSVRNVYDYENLTFKTYQDAEKALGYLKETIDIYHIALVSALYEYCNIQPSPIDFKYGWVSMDGAEVYRIPGGDGSSCGLRLPKASLVNK